MRALIVFAWVTGISSAALAQQPGTLIGRQSCAAATCHGGVIGRGDQWRYASTLWSADDPHVGAGLVLKGELTKHIVSALNPDAAKKGESDSWEIDQNAFDTLLRQRCISCHVTATPEDCNAGGTLEDSFLTQGVSCESCHGGASGWIDAHYAKGFVASDTGAGLGMRDTQTIVGRATGCVRCHVGSRTEDGMVRDMNHDIIAAGHPVLRFDVLHYDEGLPRHWDIKKTPEFYASPVRLRTVGRAVTLASAATLAGERAADHAAEVQANKPWDQREVPWPEFSDYDCFACHQSLNMDKYVLPASDPKSSLRISDGLPIWNSWHTVGQEELSKQVLAALSPRQVNPAMLAAGAKKLADTYKQKAQTLASAPGVDAAAFLEQAKARLDPAPRDWHDAAITFLDVDAALRELGQSDENYQRQHDAFLKTIRPLLQFKPEFRSPARFNRDYSKAFRTKLLEVLEP